jgi:glycosyltransferase involved in cell wall biosynthesis
VKVLILHQHFNIPQKGGAIRSYYLAKALVQHNIQPIVITGHNEKNYKQENIEGIEVHYLPVEYHNRFGFWKRSLSFIRYNEGAVRLVGKMKDISVCYAISVPLTIGLAAWWIKVRHRIEYIFEVGDLWPEAPIQMEFVKSFLLKKSLYRLEKFIYEQAKSVVALSPMIQAAIEKKVRGKKVHLLTNMSDTAFYNPETKEPGLIQKFGVGGKFVVSYIGAIGLANGLDYFVECARASQRLGLPIHFLLCGDGALTEYIRRISQQHQLSNFTLLPFENRDGVREIMNVTDASFICYKPIPVLETGSPNKYFDALAAGKLVIVNFGGWIKDEIENQQCGVSVDPKHPTDFVSKIKAFVENREKLKSYQQASRTLAESKYSRRMLSEKFVDILRS